MRDKKRKMNKLKHQTKKSEMKECTFKPQLNKTATLSPSPKYKYYQLRKNLEGSYSKQRELQKVVQEQDNYELYGKHIQQAGRLIVYFLALTVVYSPKHSVYEKYKR